MHEFGMCLTSKSAFSTMYLRSCILTSIKFSICIERDGIFQTEDISFMDINFGVRNGFDPGFGGYASKPSQIQIYYHTLCMQLFY